MIKSFSILFNYADFIKKLKHYFKDSAPIYAEIEVELNEVKIRVPGKPCVQVPIMQNLSVKKNVEFVIAHCENNLYPKMRIEKYYHVMFSEDIRRMLICQGHSLDFIRKKEIHDDSEVFIITRFNYSKNTIDYRKDVPEESISYKAFRAYFNRPLILSRDMILDLSQKGKEGMNELYKFITENSRIEELKHG